MVSLGQDTEERYTDTTHPNFSKANPQIPFNGGD